MARSIGDDELLARLLYTAGTLAFGQGRYRDALGMHREGLAVAVAAGDRTGEAFARHGLCETLYFVGPMDQALEEGRECDRLFRELGQRPMVYHNLYMVAWLLWLRGDVDESLAAGQESVAGNRELGNRRDEGFALGGTAQVLITLGELGDVSRCVERAIAIAREIGTPRLELAARSFQMMLAAEAGRFDDVTADAKECFQIADDLGTNFMRPRLWAMLGWVAAHQGDREAARRQFAEAMVQTDGVLLDDLSCLHLAMVAWDLAGSEPDLRSSADRLLDIAGPESPLYAAWGRYGIAAADLLAGRTKEALEAAEAVAEDAGRRRDRMLEWRALRVAWKAALALERRWDALSLRARARERLGEIAGTTTPGPDRDGLVARPDVAEVMGDDGASPSVVDALSAEDLLQLSQESTVRSLEDGATVFRQGDPGDHTFVVDAGAVGISIAGAGGDGPKRVGLLGPGELFGEVSLLDEGPRTADAVAQGPTRVIEVPREAFLRLLERRPDVAERLVELLRERLDEAQAAAADRGDVPARLARAVQRLAEQEGRAGSTVEVLPVFLRDGAVAYLRPDAEDSWLVPGSASSHPGAAAAAALESAGLAARAVHSTSWRHDRGRLVLTYLAVLDDPGVSPTGLRAAQVRRASLARGSAVGPPPAIGIEAVVEHALRHLAWLLADDPAVRQALGPEWAAALAGYQPEPFRALG
jgi:CRP-like cAMP-binding protein